MDSNLIAPHLQAFFADYLCQQKRQSPKTIISCRDTFRLLLIFLREQTGVEPSALRIADLDAPVVLRFLNYLEQRRGNSVRSRNIRLSAIRSFFRWVALRDPESIGVATRVLAIPTKREDKKLIAYLGYVWSSCKKLQAREKRRPKIISFRVFGHIINPTVFFVHDFAPFYRFKMVY
jgi:site-specific recombinase XerD